MEDQTIKFSYFSVNDALDAHHPYLSGYWTMMGWNDKVATVGYTLEDGSEEDVTVDLNGKVTAPEKVMAEMEAMLKYNQIRKQIKKLNDRATHEDNMMNYKKADELRNRAYFLSQVLENKSRGF